MQYGNGSSDFGPSAVGLLTHVVSSQSTCHGLGPELGKTYPCNTSRFPLQQRNIVPKSSRFVLASNQLTRSSADSPRISEVQYVRGTNQQFRGNTKASRKSTAAAIPVNGMGGGRTTTTSLASLIAPAMQRATRFSFGSRQSVGSRMVYYKKNLQKKQGKTL